MNFPDGKYGDEIFLLDAGIQLVPGDMGDKPIPGMHGYSPLDKDSEASLLASSPPPMIPSGIAGFFTLMQLALRKLARIKNLWKYRSRHPPQYIYKLYCYRDSDISRHFAYPLAFSVSW